MLGANQNIVYSRNISKQGQVFWKKRKVVNSSHMIVYDMRYGSMEHGLRVLCVILYKKTRGSFQSILERR